MSMPTAWGDGSTQICCPNLFGHVVGFLGLSSAETEYGLDDPCVSLPAKDI